MDNAAVHQLCEIITQSDHIVFFGGAGVSTESGIPDFRSATGLYRTSSGSINAQNDAFLGYAPEEMLHTRFFYQHTAKFYHYYFTHLVYPDAQPNAAHIALAELERQGKLRAVITQNVDGLHQVAGSQCVIELHGSAQRNFCTRCGLPYTLPQILAMQPPHDIDCKNSRCLASPTAWSIPVCESCGGIIKPDVVLYGETLPEDALQEAVQYISKADVLIVGGTSLSVYPAAGLVQYFNGQTLALVNRDETTYDRDAHIVIRDAIGAVLTACVLDVK